MNNFDNMKRGFTLIELLAVVIILGLIALITTPIVLSSMSKTKEELFTTQIGLIKAGAINYVTDQVAHKKSGLIYNAVINHTSTTITIKLHDLQEAGVVDINISNPFCKGDDKYFSPDTSIKLRYDGKEFDYELDEDSLRDSCTAKISWS